MRRITVLIATLALAVSAMAFIEDKPPGAQFTPEQSQDQVARQQAANGTHGVVGTVETDTEGRFGPQGGGDENAVSVLTGPGSEEAKETIVQEGRRLESGASGGRWWLWALIFGALGFGVVLGARAYANRVVPVPGHKKQNW